MNGRTVQILDAAIQEFIRTGEPVSSGRLYEQYDFGIKPAMIRLELDALEEAGYLEQPYHSAGRVPSDLGYEFFAARAFDEALAAHREARNAFAELFAERAWSDLLCQLSAELGLLGVAADPANGEIYKTGLEALVDHLDWEDRGGIRSVIRDFEEVDERLPRAAGKVGRGPRVFIGKKSPVTKSGNLSVVGGNYQVGDATVSIFAIGPKRMDYKRAIGIFMNL